MIPRLADAQSSFSRDASDGAPGKFRVRVDASADRRSAQGQFAEVLLGRAEAFDTVLDLAGITAEFLPKPYGRGILQMGAADFEDIVKFDGFPLERLVQLNHRRNEAALDSFQRGQMNRSRYGVVARLAAVDVVIGMDQLPAALAAEQFPGAIGDDLVGVHVGRSAGAGLENIQDELAVPLAINDLLGRLDNGGGQFRFEIAQLLIGQCGVFLNQPQRSDKPARKTQFADGKILDRTGGLRAVISGCGNLHRSHGIGLTAKRFVHAAEHAQKPRSMQESGFARRTFSIFVPASAAGKSVALFSRLQLKCCLRGMQLQHKMIILYANYI